MNNQIGTAIPKGVDPLRLLTGAEVSADAWDKFVRRSPQRSPFVMSGLLRAWDVEPEFVLVQQDDELVAGAVLLRRGGEIVRAPLPYTMYQGVLLGPSYEALPPHRASSTLMRWMEFLLAELERRFHRVSFCLHPSFPDLRAFSWFHYHARDLGMFQVSLFYTAELDLHESADLDTYLAGIRNLRRREYRRAKSLGFRAIESTDYPLLSKLYRLTFERQQLDTAGHEQVVANIARVAVEGGFGKMLACVDEQGRTASMTLFLYDDRCGYYLIGANDPELRNTGASTCLMVENIVRCRDMGLKKVDFVGANSPNRGDYKISFNTAVVPYFTVDWQKPHGNKLQ